MYVFSIPPPPQKKKKKKKNQIILKLELMMSIIKEKSLS